MTRGQFSEEIFARRESRHESRHGLNWMTSSARENGRRFRKVLAFYRVSRGWPFLLAKKRWRWEFSSLNFPLSLPAIATWGKGIWLRIHFTIITPLLFPLFPVLTVDGAFQGKNAMNAARVHRSWAPHRVSIFILSINNRASGKVERTDESVPAFHHLNHARDGPATLFNIVLLNKYNIIHAHVRVRRFPLCSLSELQPIFFGPSSPELLGNRITIFPPRPNVGCLIEVGGREFIGLLLAGEHGKGGAHCEQEAGGQGRPEV